VDQRAGCLWMVEPDSEPDADAGDGPETAVRMRKNFE
jgi:hypothetical protein